jgi:hypothetical protein
MKIHLPLDDTILGQENVFLLKDKPVKKQNHYS